MAAMPMVGVDDRAICGSADLASDGAIGMFQEAVGLSALDANPVGVALRTV